jgi:ribonucleoside-diphosphate reductase alpha chain
MFEPTEFGRKIYAERYAFNDGKETWEEGCSRVAKHVATAETNGLVKTCYETFYQELISGRFYPGGRIWYGSGRPKGQLLNCFVTPNPHDSREGWGSLLSDMIVISGTGGGVGSNYSTIRPRGSEIRGHSGKATGAVSLMRIVDAAGEVIRAGGGRRTALMMALNHDHPDLLEFMDTKLDDNALTNANVSVVFMNESPEAFLRKVENDELHDLKWRGEVKAQVPARQIWDKIISNSVQSGEPGILNGWLANQQNNIYYATSLCSTNPCGEIWLSGHECCDLGALVLPRFVVNGRLDLKQLARTIHTSVRFLDNVLDVNTYPLPKIEETCKNFRRIGLGVMGLHDMLIMLGKKYSSDESLEFIDWLFSFIKHKSYEASLFLAAEKGQFPAMDRGKFVESGFCRTLKESILENILRTGMRNCTTLTIAPTGTTSIVAGVSSGIEPIISYAYRRRWQQEDHIASEVIEHPLFTEFKDTDKVGLFESAFEIPVERHVAVQAVAQKHVDSAISKTINMPRHYTSKDMEMVVRKYIGQVKGLTLYRDGSRGESPIEPLTLEEALGSECRSGVCEL